MYGFMEMCNYVRLPLIAVAFLDGTLAIYDLTTQNLRHRCKHEVTTNKFVCFYHSLHCKQIVYV